MKMIQETLQLKPAIGPNEEQTKVHGSIVADFFYSARGGSNETSHRLMLQSLLHQALEQEPSIFKFFETPFRRLLGESTGRIEWSYDNLRNILLSLSLGNVFDMPWTSGCKIYFLLDAMDESENGNEDGRRRTEVLSLLSELCSRKGEIIFKIIIASRPANDIEKTLRGIRHIELQKENTTDIEKVVDTGLRLLWESMNEDDDDFDSNSGGSESGEDSDSNSDGDLSAKTPKGANGQRDQKSLVMVSGTMHDINEDIYKEELRFVGEYLTRHADGVILWVVLILDKLLRHVEKGSHTKREIKEKLESLPMGLESIYEEIVVRLRGKHDEKGIAQGRLMLTWGSFAKRPLTVQELRDAIAIPTETGYVFERPTDFLDENRIHIPDETNWAPIRRRIADMCGSLLEVVRPNSENLIKIHCKSRRVKPTYVVQLLHQTVKDFLVHSNSASPLNLDQTHGQCLIATILLRYLTLSLPMENLQRKPIQDWGQKEYMEFVKYLLNRPLLGYILSFLQHHIRDLGADATRLELEKFLQELQGQPECHAWALLDSWCRLELLLPSAPPESSVLAETFKAKCLITASQAGHADVVRLMLEARADLMREHRDRKTVLHQAAERGHEAVVRLLLEKGAAIEAKDSTGGTALHQAAGNGHETIVRLLLENGAAIETNWGYGGGTALHWAARNGHEAVVRLLLEKGAAIEAKDEIEWTALYWAAVRGYEAVVQVLLDKGAAIKATGGMALYWAARNGHEAVVRLLIEKGATIEAKDSTRGTALHHAAGNGHEAVVRLLLENGAATEANWGYGGGTALHWAARNGHEAVVRLLLENGAAIEANWGYGGGTALHWAAGNGHEAVVRLLIKNGATIDAKDGIGGTALYWAAGNGHEGIVRLLLL